MAQGPRRIADWTLEQKEEIYLQLFAILPPPLLDAAHTRAFAVLSDSWRGIAADGLALDRTVLGADAVSPGLLSGTLRMRLDRGEPVPFIGWLALVADEVFADFFVQSFLARTLRQPGLPDPPRFAEPWIRTLPDHLPPPGAWRPDGTFDVIGPNPHGFRPYDTGEFSDDRYDG
ncbi:hypothetical protein ABZ477_16675 [Microbacterium sp. NPDC019599]|uniref:hypothetical protein n=1 Tax=Microbacterium sp. NPDC019599 TaxID=3154690 RepID=UPI0033C0DC5C